MEDEKMGEIDTAKSQYCNLMQILRRENPENPYSLLPSELRDITIQYEKCGALRNSMNFRDALSKYFEMIDVTSESKSELREISNRSIFDVGSWYIELRSFDKNE